jgi:hypothetical protein
VAFQLYASANQHPHYTVRMPTLQPLSFLLHNLHGAALDSSFGNSSRGDALPAVVLAFLRRLPESLMDAATYPAWHDEDDMDEHRAELDELKREGADALVAFMQQSGSFPEVFPAADHGSIMAVVLKVAFRRLHAPQWQEVEGAMFVLATLTEMIDDDDDDDEDTDDDDDNNDTSTSVALTSEDRMWLETLQYIRALPRHVTVHASAAKIVSRLASCQWLHRHPSALSCATDIVLHAMGLGGKATQEAASAMQQVFLY